MAPKVFTIIYDTELGKPYVFLSVVKGIELARGINGTEGRGTDKKRMLML